MTIRIGINGVGRTGRNLWRLVHSGVPGVEIAAVNDTADAAVIARLLQADTIRGRFPARVQALPGAIVVDGAAVPLSHHAAPDRIDWSVHGVELVVESTGQFTRAGTARGHLRGGAHRVIIATASPDADVSLMMGINEHEYEPARHRIVSNSCCTTYCVATMLSTLHHAYGVVSGSLTAAYSAGSRPGPLLDGVHPNLRMARANAINIVPASLPGVRYALDRIMPELAGRIAATALRVPVRAVSAASLVVRLARPVSVAEVNATLEAAATSVLKGYLEVSHQPLVSSDVLGAASSCIVDTGLTSVLGDLVRVVGWYDNEWGYSHRLIDLVRFIANRTT
jgi:glyceraldehyde 3-phosphate dehydrogenase